MCEFCLKIFQFPMELTTHRDSNTLEKTCTPVLTVPKNLPLTKSCWSTRRCIRILCTLVHTVKRLNIQCSMDQHVRGTHGPGWATPCGNTVDWPRKLSSHKCHCENCKAILLQRKCDALDLKAQIATKNK